MTDPSSVAVVEPTGLGTSVWTVAGSAVVVNDLITPVEVPTLFVPLALK